MADKVINIGNNDNKVTVNVTDKIVCPTFEGTATKVGHKLSFGNKTFDGSSTVILSGTDLGSVDLTSEQTIIGQKTFSGETYLDSLNVNTGLISGNLRVVNGIFGNLTGNVIGNLSGNANTATKLQTARTLTIGNTGKSFDGSSNVSWTLSEIGAASSSHTHNYLPLSGGTVTGQLYLTGLAEGTLDLTDNTELLTSYASNNGFSDTNATGKVYKRDAIHVYNYIKSKLDSVYSAIGHTHNYAGSNSVGGAANLLKGNYTYNGGQQMPNYFGKNKIGALMMSTKINGNSQYKDFFIIDCYHGDDAGGAVAFGVNRQSLGAYIMRSTAERTSWTESAELLGTHNYTSYTVKKDGTGASGTWNINISGNANGITNSDILDSQEKIDNFITANKFQYAIFQTSDSNNVNFNNNDGIILSIPWRSSNYGVQMAFDDTTGGTVKVRGKSNSWGSWYTLLHSGNYNSYAPKLDGTGASGTWGISITGNAATATNVAWSGVTNKPNLINSFGTKTGDITIRGGQTDNGSVNLAMSNNELQASIVGLGSNAYTSTAYLPLTGGTLTGTLTLPQGNSLRFGNGWYHSDTWDIANAGDNLGITILNAVGKVETGSPSSYAVGLSISGYYSMQIAAYGSGRNFWIRAGKEEWKELYHTGNLSPMTTSHPANSITQTNINNWNAVHTWYTTATANDTTNTIDTWKEIEAFVSSFKKGDNLATYLQNNYIAKATAKNYVVTLDDIQTITGAKTFSGDFYVGGTSGSRCHIKMDTTNKCIKFIFD